MFDLTANNFFENKDLSQYKVSIQISLDGFSFLITREKGDEIIAGKNSPLKINSSAVIAHHFYEWYLSEPFLKLPFQKVRVYIFEELFTLVPAGADENMAEQINRILLGKETERKYFLSKTINGVNVNFSVHSELVSQVDKAFNEVEWIHPVAVLLNHLPATGKPNLSVLIRTQNHYFLIIRQRTKLLLANCFAAHHSTDLVYQIINTFRQLKVSRNLTQLMISGTSKMNRKTTEILAPYFPDILDFAPEIAGFKEVNSLHYYLETLQ